MVGLDERIASISFGSSAVIFAATPAPRLDGQARYLLTPHVQAGWYGREMDLLSTGTGYRWLSHLFGWDEGRIDQAAAEVPAGARGLFFAPYLGGGEQGALWNPRLRGALLGLSLAHGRAEIARAYLEGVFFEVRRCVEVLAENGPIDALRVAGKIAESPAGLAMLCDILNRPVSVWAERSPAATGAARLARRLLRRRAQSARVQELSGTRTPDPSSAGIYESLYAEYLVRAATCG